MRYYLASIKPVSEIDPDVLEQIVRAHGNYDEFNKQLAACCNQEDQIDAFERILPVSDLEWLSSYNVTLFSAEAVADVLQDIQLDVGVDTYGARANRDRNVPYIAINTDTFIDLDITEVTDQILTNIRITIHHELSLIDQMSRGDLSFSELGVMWMNDLYTYARIDELLDVETNLNNPEAVYLLQRTQLPWELEAYGECTYHEDLKSLFTDPELLEVMEDIRVRYKEKYID